MTTTSAAYEPETFMLPLPLDFDDEPLGDVLTRANSLCGSAEAIASAMSTSGQQLTPSEREHVAAQKLFLSPHQELQDTGTGIAIVLTALLQDYDREFVVNVQQIRNVCINTLLETVSKGKTTEKLRAVELLGKVADVGLFVERTHQVIEHRPDEDLKAILKEKLGKLRQISGVKDSPQEVTFQEIETQEASA